MMTTTTTAKTKRQPAEAIFAIHVASVASVTRVVAETQKTVDHRIAPIRNLAKDLKSRRRARQNRRDVANAWDEIPEAQQPTPESFKQTLSPPQGLLVDMDHTTEPDDTHRAAEHVAERDTGPTPTDSREHHRHEREVTLLNQRAGQREQKLVRYRKTEYPHDLRREQHWGAVVDEPF
jgi:hypothetical protein